MAIPAPLRVAVIGGGITGLSAAHRLVELSGAASRPLEITLYEGSERLGGVFGTESIDGYRLERGADMFITDKPWGVNLCRRLGLEDRLIAPDPRYRQSLILCRGRPEPTPEAFRLMVPGKLGPILTTPLLSPLGKLRLICEPLIPRRRAEPGDDESLASFVRRRLGREALERIVQPLVGGIYTGDPEKLSLAATLPRFQTMEREQGSLSRGLWRNWRSVSETARSADGTSGARYGLFVSLRDGMSELQEALISKLKVEVRVCTGRPVIGLERIACESAPVAYRVVTSGGIESYDAVVLALPAYRAADLIGCWQPQLAGELRGIEYASSVIVVTGHKLSDVAHPLNAYGLVIPARERRQILAVSFLSRKFRDRAPGDRVILRTFVGGALQPELCARDDTEILALVAAEIQDILGVTGTPEVTRVVRYERAMPQYHVGHLDRVRRIESLQATVPGLYLCGNAYRGVGLPDCIRDGEAAAESLFATLAAQFSDGMAAR